VNNTSELAYESKHYFTLFKVQDVCDEIKEQIKELQKEIKEIPKGLPSSATQVVESGLKK